MRPILRQRSIVFLSLSLLLGVRVAAALEVTAVSSDTVVLDGVLRLGGLSLIQDAGGRSWVRFPVDSGPQGRSYADLRLQDRGLHERLKEALASGRTGVPAKRLPTFSVGGVRLLRSAVRVANVEGVFDSELIIVFGVLRRADGSLCVVSPAAKRDGRYVPYLDILDPGLRKSVESAVLKAYQEGSPEGVGK